MNLEDLQTVVTKKELKELKEAQERASRTGYFPNWNNGKTYLEEKNEEDVSLRLMKCPKCQSDVTLSVYLGTSYYRCSKENALHFFTRWQPLSLAPAKKEDETTIPDPYIDYGVCD